MENKQTNTASPVQRTSQNQQDSIDLVEIFYLFFGHLWQILAMLVVGGIAAFLLTYFFVTPMYQASAKLYMVSASNESQVNMTDLQLGAQLAPDYQELLKSRLVLEEVRKNLELEQSTDVLAGMISITAGQNTRILKITVTSSDPKLAADIANELATQACVMLPRIMETDPPNLVETALVPTQKSSPSYSKNTIMGALMLAVLYCGIMLVKYLMNDTLVTPEDVERHFGLQPLATIPEADLGSFNKQEKKKKRGKRGVR